MKISRSCRLSAALLLFLVLLPAACREPPGSVGPRPAARGLDAAGRMQIGPQDRCPVCAMPVADHEAFSAAIVLADGTVFYFCSAGCMMRAWLHPEIHLAVPARKLTQSVVRDYFSGDFLDGDKALWVSGSDVLGPMGPALVPLSSPPDLAAFRRRHGGGEAFRLSELNDEDWETLTGKRAKR